MNEQLLLVEDDDAVADVVALHMVQAGYRVHREADGRRAVAAVDRQRWDLVLLDIMLPGMDGLDVCRHVRARPGHLPIIMLSARTAEVHRVLGLELGADDYLAKPFSMLELTARVRALLRRVEQMQRPAAEAAPLRFGPWRLEPIRRELYRDQTLVPLTLREFDLLHFLLRHPLQVFSRAELLERVWGTAFDGYEHTVNSHINRLRNKIEADPHNPRRIATVWGVGYRFDPAAGDGMP
jgi:DNA-binding response OmpR family regulator